MAPIDFHRIYTRHGIPHELEPGWWERQRPGPFHPVGGMVHHTAMGAAGRRVVRDGRPGLGGPLGNENLPRSGALIVLGAGRANDSGSGCVHVLERIRKGLPPVGPAPHGAEVDGNPWFLDVEVDNNGIGERYPDPQIGLLVRSRAALAVELGWRAEVFLHHYEWTSRKIDMSWRGPLREWIALHMLNMAGFAPAPPPPPPPPAKVVGRLHLAEFPEDVIVRIEMTVNLDNMGRGWLVLDGKGRRPRVKFGHLVSVRPQGSHPVRDRGYWPIPETAEQEYKGNTLLTIEGGIPGGATRLWLHVAERSARAA